MIRIEAKTLMRHSPVATRAAPSVAETSLLESPCILMLPSTLLCSMADEMVLAHATRSTFLAWPTCIHEVCCHSWIPWEALCFRGGAALARHIAYKPTSG